MHDVLEPLARELDRLASVDLAALGASERSQVIVELHQLTARLEAQTVRAVGSWDADRIWDVDGARNAVAWLKWQTRIPERKARQHVRLARRLRDMPATEAAWQAGQIDSTHVDRLAAARRDHLAADFAEHEQNLVDAARDLPYRKFNLVVDYWLLAADPDGTDATAAERHARRGFRLSESLDGMWFGDLLLDPIGGTIVHSMLARIESELYHADMAAARARIGDGATATDLARTLTQRRADALIEMARRAGTAPKDGKRPDPLFSIHIDYQTFTNALCQLAGGTLVAPGSLLPWLTDAYIERIIFDGPGRIVDLGPQRRLFTGATRRLVQLAHQECYHPSCDIPAEDCQIDHVEPYAQGGATIGKNGRPACDHHNLIRNRPPPHDSNDP